MFLVRAEIQIGVQLLIPVIEGVIVRCGPSLHPLTPNEFGGKTFPKWMKSRRRELAALFGAQRRNSENDIDGRGDEVYLSEGFKSPRQPDP